MLGLDEYASYDGLGLAGLVARGDVTPRELRDSALRAIEKVNPELNAVLQVLAERSAEEIDAGVSEGPFRGVPFLIKELVIHAADVPLDMGSRFAQGTVAPHDTELLARFRRSGLVLVGTTQTPELGYCPTTETVLHGPVHNPWKAGCSPGGSSGGSAAAVAAGIVPVAHANDGGGSIRIPASCNGLVGLKPTRDRVPSGPDMSDPLFGFAVEFAVTKTVRDAATLLDCVAGPDVGAPGLLIPPHRPFADEVGRAPGELRVAWTASPASGKEIHPECRAAVETTAALLEDLGHRVTEASPRFAWDEFLRATHIIWAAYTAGAVNLLASTSGREPSPANLETATWACFEEGRKLSAVELIAALDYGNVLSRSFGAFFEEYDVLVTPTMARPPVLHGEIDQNRSGITAWEWTEQVFDWCPFTPAFNTTGQPAVSVPMHWSDEGLPVGVQLGGRFADEAALLRLAAQLEEAKPWSERRPPGHVAA